MSDDNLYLINIFEYIRRIASFTSEGRRHIFSDLRTQDAVIRNFEIIGEATKRVHASTRQLHPEVPWRRMSGLRDVLIHQYEGVDLEEIWAIIEVELPELQTHIGRILGSRGIRVPAPDSSPKR